MRTGVAMDDERADDSCVGCLCDFVDGSVAGGRGGADELGFHACEERRLHNQRQYENVQEGWMERVITSKEMSWSLSIQLWTRSFMAFFRATSSALSWSCWVAGSENSIILFRRNTANHNVLCLTGLATCPPPLPPPSAAPPLSCSFRALSTMSRSGSSTGEVRTRVPSKVTLTERRVALEVLVLGVLTVGDWAPEA